MPCWEPGDQGVLMLTWIAVSDCLVCVDLSRQRLPSKPTEERSST